MFELFRNHEIKSSIQLIAVAMASILSLARCQQSPPSIPSCCDLKKMEPSVDCDVDCDAASSSGLTRSFGPATFGFGGGNFIGGFNGKFIYDVRCNQWRSVGPRECPIAYDLNSFSNFCNNFHLTAHLDQHDVSPVYILDLLGGGFETCQYAPLCVACPGLGLCDISFDNHHHHGVSHIGSGSSHSSPFGGSHLGLNHGGILWSQFSSRRGRSVESNEEEDVWDEDEDEDENDSESDCDPGDTKCLLERANYDADYDNEYGDERESKAGPGPCPCRRCRCCRRQRRPRCRWCCCRCRG